MKTPPRLSVTVLLVILIVGLLGSNIYLLMRTETPASSLIIGVPQTDADGQITAMDFSRSKTLDQPADINAVVFSLLTTGSPSDRQPPASPPDAVLSMSDSTRGMGFYIHLWLGEDSVIFSLNPDSTNVYREISGTYGDALRLLIEQHIALYK